MEIVSDRFAEPEPIVERIGVEMMKVWCEFGPGKQLITRGVTTNPAEATSRTARETAVIEIGHLHLIKLRIPASGMPQLPKPEAEFDCRTLSDEYDGRLFYAGFIRCD